MTRKITAVLFCLIMVFQASVLAFAADKDINGEYLFTVDTEFVNVDTASPEGTLRFHVYNNTDEKVENVTIFVAEYNGFGQLIKVSLNDSLSLEKEARSENFTYTLSDDCANVGIMVLKNGSLSPVCKNVVVG